jgi:CBS domain-containing protein
MIIQNCMKHTVYSVPTTATIREAAEVFVRHHVGLLPVLDEFGKPVGVVRLRDLLTLELPDFVNLIADVEFVHDFGAVETTRPAPETLERPITSIMSEVTTVEENCGLLRAYALIRQHDLYDLPVVAESGELVGIASVVDIGTSILSSWDTERTLGS